MKPGYVYAGRVAEAGLKDLVAKLSGPVILSWDLARLDFSGALRDAGCAFDATLEIRWQRAGDAFRVLVLSDQERPDLGLEPVEGEWTVTDEETVQLVDLRDRRYSPQFGAYPVVQDSKARLKCKVFSRNHIAVFLSPRGVLKDERSSS